MADVPHEQQLPHEPEHHVLIEILDSWRRLGRLLLLVFCTFLIAASLVYFILNNLPSSATELQLGSTHILLKQPSKEGDNYLLSVPPQGWFRTGIHVPEGSSISMEAGGRVHIDLSGLINALRVRGDAEKRVLQLKDPKCSAPEDCFTKEEKKAMKPAWNWVGPDGVPESAMQAHANPNRRKRSILPTASYGALIASFNDTDAEIEQPGLSEHLAANAFLVKSNYKQKATATRSGYLYFIVNDVQSQDPEFPELFTLDNIGSFYVKIVVSSKL